MRVITMRLVIVDEDDDTDPADVRDLLESWIRHGQRYSVSQTGSNWPLHIDLKLEGDHGR